MMRLAIGLLAVSGTLVSAPRDPRADLAARVATLTRESRWQQVAAIPIAFPTFHPQGMVKIGDTFFVTSVEVQQPTTRFPELREGMDRDPGRGVGHLFKIDGTGALIADLRLGEGSIYHPGGIDFDGTAIWVPVAEYRPNSRSIVYRVNPETMTATEAFRFADHLGALVHDTDDRTLHGLSWGSRRFYRWTLDGRGRVTNATAPPERLRTLNPSYYLDYQDCKYAGRHQMVCSGVTELRPVAGRGAVPPGRDRPHRPEGSPSNPPGPAPGLDAGRPGHDPQPGLARGHTARPAGLLHAGGRPVDDLRVRNRGLTAEPGFTGAVCSTRRAFV